MIAALTSLGALPTAQAASDLVDAGLLSSADPVEFRHPVVRSAVLADMRVSDRLAAQRRAAEVLVDAEVAPERAASYLIDTLPDRDPFVVRTLRDAAARSVAQGASESAVAYLRRALAEPPTDARAPDVLHELGIAELNSGSPDAPESLRASVAALGDRAPERTDLVLAYARSLILVGDMTAASDLLATTRETLVGAEREQLEAHVLMAAMLDPALRAQAEAIVATVDSSNPLLLAALSSETARRGLERERCVDHATRALASPWLADPDPLLLLLHALFPLTVAGEELEAARVYATAIDAARRRGDVFSVAALSVFRGWLRVRTGELLAAEEDLQPTGQGTEVDDPSFRLYRAVFLAEVLLERGEIDAARALLAGPFTVNAPVHQSYSLYVSGRLAMALNRPQAALDDFLALGDVVRGAGDRSTLRGCRGARPPRSRRFQLGRDDEARTLAAAELDAARRWGAPWALGVALRAVGLSAGAMESSRCGRRSRCSSRRPPGSSMPAR